MNNTPKRSSYIIPIAVGLILTISFVALGVSVYHKWSTNEEKRFRHIRESVAEQVSESLVIPLWNLNTRSIEKISQIYISTGNRLVMAVIVKDENGKVLKRSLSKLFEKAEISESSLFKEVRTLKYNDQNIGEVEIMFSNITTDENLNIIFSFLGAWFITALLLTLLIISIVLYYILIKPLEHFKSRAQLISKGDYRPIHESFLLEDLSSLARTLNTALKEVNIRDEKLQKYNEELGEMVAKKTQELYEQRERNHESERLAALGQMAAGIAHEINNPLFIIQGNISRIRRSSNCSNQELWISKVDSAITRISEIIKSMSTMARDGQEDERQLIRCTELETTIKAICEGRIRDKDINLSFEFIGCSNIENCCIYANKTQLLQVLVNLINNSIDAIEDLEVRFIKVRIREEAQKRFIDVIDSGNGIDKKIESRIMEPFFTTKDINKGTGLGLSLSYEIMVKNGGHLKYDPSNENTTFTISLPMNSGPEQAILH